MVSLLARWLESFKWGVAVDAIAPGVFHTAMNANLLDTTPRGHEECRFFVAEETIVGGFLAGVHQ